MYRSVYESNREVFRAWGYRTDDCEFVSLGDKAAFLTATKVYSEPFAHTAKKHAYGELDTDCVNADCVEVANGLMKIGCNPAILNLASRYHACGAMIPGLVRRRNLFAAFPP